MMAFAGTFEKVFSRERDIADHQKAVHRHDSAMFTAE
jgi:hypothetical protein